ncbi:aldehyde dehydrogenase (NADP(+)) [Cryptosporangium aurantiacum]|uniref:NADP-dependent aldehyde dehydrogenase n=1 Tax=Cryptosporangium aurantiacum TaxID=134849 RepID=A0A1M7P726_9ACTN|nr:aldehyde dehydrogenase (NADP(+)) [Cryptosporangium aurantiacum]SHN12436.1 NADP-dependent aldehyde dehydrogenase [Cryptosporangium aurantiacum]
MNRVTAAAADAVPGLAALGRAGRARLLRAAAEEIEARREALVATAARETFLGDARLGGEVTRTAYQLRVFADVLDEGSYLEATIDHAGDTPMGPGPDLRRMLVPVGPVAVFGASNFPLAFSVPGGDTASALAAGCPVVVKAHESHPSTSALAFSALEAAASRVGAPSGTVGIVYGREAGAELVTDPLITAVGFTGSLAGGQALRALIETRPSPIPFYGELASLNPLVVTPGAAAERAASIADGLVASITGSLGQLCTKPGLVFVPADASGDELVARAASLVAAAPAGRLLNERVSEGYAAIGASLRAEPGVALAGPRVGGEGLSDAGFSDAGFSDAGLSGAGGAAAGLSGAGGAAAGLSGAGGAGGAAVPALLTVDAAGFTPALAEECFGPLALIVRYSSSAELLDVLASLPGSLTATVHSADGDDLGPLLAVLQPRAGRLLFDAYPTGVLVSWAQTHGGPWPSTNTVHTSVGPTAIRRFLRPLTWQNAPEHVLPAELRDGYEGIPRRVDGVLALPGTGVTSALPGPADRGR